MLRQLPRSPALGQYLDLFQSYTGDDAEKLMVSALIGLGDDSEPGDCGGEFPDGADDAWAIRFPDPAQVPPPESRISIRYDGVPLHCEAPTDAP